MKITRHLYILALLAVIFAPEVLLAQGSLFSIVRDIGVIISRLIPVAAALALLYFFWGLAKFILAAGDEGSRAEGKQIMIWGVIALFVLVSVWGLVAVIQRTFSIDQTTEIDIPKFR